MKRYFLSVIAVILFFSCSTQISEETSVVVNLPGTITSRSALDNKRFEIKLTSDTGVFATLSEVSGSKATFNNVEPGDYWVEVRVYDIEGHDKFPVYTGRSGRFTVISGQTAVASVYLRKYKEKIKEVLEGTLSDISANNPITFLPDEEPGGLTRYRANIDLGEILAGDYPPGYAISSGDTIVLSLRGSGDVMNSFEYQLRPAKNDGTVYNLLDQENYHYGVDEWDEMWRITLPLNFVKVINEAKISREGIVIKESVKNMDVDHRIVQVYFDSDEQLDEDDYPKITEVSAKIYPAAMKHYEFVKALDEDGNGEPDWKLQTDYYLDDNRLQEPLPEETQVTVRISGEVVSGEEKELTLMIIDKSPAAEYYNELCDNPITMELGSGYFSSDVTLEITDVPAENGYVYLQIRTSVGGADDETVISFNNFNVEVISVEN